MGSDDERDWTYKLARLAGLLGFNEMRIRWRLIKLQRNMREGAASAQNRSEWVRYEHQTCSLCGALQDREEKKCVRCGAALPGRAAQVLDRVGLWTRLGRISTSTLLVMLMTAIYARMALDSGTWFTFELETLVDYGGSVPALVWGGQPWRLSTSVFLHAGLWHIGFNMFALVVVGPAIERIHGRGRMVLLFMITGLVASLASALSRDVGVGIGASGAIMGLIGVAAGWGHRQKTVYGRELRNQMLKWCLYVVIFGFLIRADNVAHLAGFVSGGLLGLVPIDRRSPVRFPRLGLVVDAVGMLAALATIVVCFYPRLLTGPALGEVLEDDYTAMYRRLNHACELHRAGSDEDAARFLDPGEDLEGACGIVEPLRDQCDAFVQQGVDGLPGGERLTGAARERTRQNYENWCRAFE